MILTTLTVSCLNNFQLEGFIRTNKELIFYYPIVPTAKPNIFLRRAKIVKKEENGWGTSEDILLLTTNASLPLSQWKRVPMSKINTERLRLA
jgi:hypothetical protein